MLAKGEIAAPLLGRAPGGAEALRPAGDEGEIGRRRGGGREPPSLIGDEEAAVEALPQLDAAAGVGAAVRPARDLGEARPEPDGVVAGHDARVAAAEAIGEIPGRAAPRGGGLGGGLSEAPVVVGEVRGQEGLSRRGRLDAVPPQLGDEAVLQSCPQAFDAALGLGGVRGDVPDPEVLEDLPEVGRVLSALELFLEAPVRVVADEDSEAVAVEGHGQPVAGGELPEQGEIAMQIFRGTEVQGQDGAGRIVDGPEEAHGRPRAEPVELTAVDEDEAAHRRAPGAAGSVLGGPAAPLRGQTERPSEAADRLAANRQAFDGAELLGAVAVIEIAVRRPDQLEHAVPNLDLQRPGRGPAPEAVDQSPDPLGPIPGLEAAELPRSHGQGVRPGRRRDLPGHRQLH